MTHPNLIRLCPLLFAAACIATSAYADEPASPTSAAPASAAAPVPTHHRLMKDCMAKQKAAGSGKPKYELTQACKDVVKTQKENADAGKKQTDADATTGKPAPL